MYAYFIKYDYYSILNNKIKPTRNIDITILFLNEHPLQHF